MLRTLARTVALVAIAAVLAGVLAPLGLAALAPSGGPEAWRGDREGVEGSEVRPCPRSAAAIELGSAFGAEAFRREFDRALERLEVES